MNGLIQRVVLNLQYTICLRIQSFHSGIPDILRVLNQRCVVVLVSKGVQIKVRDMIPQICQPPICLGVCHGVRRPHVGWEVPQKVCESDLVEDHLVLELRRGDLCEFLVRPGVRAHLVPVGNHAADESWPRGGRVVHGAFAHVAAHNEEGSFGVVFLVCKTSAVEEGFVDFLPQADREGTQCTPTVRRQTSRQ